MVEDLLQPDPHAHHEIGRCFLHFVRNSCNSCFCKLNVNSTHFNYDVLSELLKLRGTDATSLRNIPQFTGACDLKKGGGKKRSVGASVHGYADVLHVLSI